MTVCVNGCGGVQGLGKTAQTIGLCAYLHRHCGIRGPFLIVAPLSTAAHWQREFEAWTDFNAVIYHGSYEARQIIEDYEFASFERSEKVRPQQHTTSCRIDSQPWHQPWHGSDDEADAHSTVLRCCLCLAAGAADHEVEVHAALQRAHRAGLDAQIARGDGRRHTSAGEESETTDTRSPQRGCMQSSAVQWLTAAVLLPLAVPVDWKLLVCDEGHRLKNTQSELAQTLSSFSAASRIILTGTVSRRQPSTHSLTRPLRTPGCSRISPSVVFPPLPCAADPKQLG